MLRGPQGTLYGKNTIGGAIKLDLARSRDPVPYVAGSLGGGNYEMINGSATLNAPIIDDLLYSRFSFAGKDNEGYTRNLVDGTHYNNENLTAFRGQFRLLPHEYVTLDLAGHYSHQREDTRGAKCRFSDPRIANARFRSASPTGAAFAENTSDYRFATELGDHDFLDSYGSSLVAAWEGGSTLGLDSLDLKSVSAWQQQEVQEGFMDLDASANPFLFQLSVDEQHQTQWSQEIQAVTAALDDKLRLTTGLYGFWEWTRGGDVLSSSFFQQRQERVTIANTSYAIYGQTSYTPLEWLELTVGVRETWEKKRAERTIVFNQLAGNEPPEERADDNFSQFTPMASCGAEGTRRADRGHAARQRRSSTSPSRRATRAAVSRRAAIPRSRRSRASTRRSSTTTSSASSSRCSTTACCSTPRSSTPSTRTCSSRSRA